MKGIVCEKKVYDDRVITHHHPYAQLVFPLCGTMEVATKTKNFTVDESSIFLLPFDHEHSFKADGRNQFLIMDIPSPMFDPKQLNFSEGIQCEFNDKWKAVRSLLLDEMQNGSCDAMSKLFYYFIPGMINHSIPESIQYINEHYSDNVDIQTLAQIQNYSTTYYSEWFKKEMGQPPAEYIQQKRIERAKELLSHTNLSIMQIACEIGYNYESSFTKVFKLRENVSPKAYRQGIL